MHGDRVEYVVSGVGWGWPSHTLIDLPSFTHAPHRHPPTTPQSKLDSDLFELMKRKTQATALSVSRDGAKLAVVGRDRQIRVLDLRRGKLLRVYNEALEVFEAAQATGTLGIDSIDFGRCVVCGLHWAGLRVRVCCIGGWTLTRPLVLDNPAHIHVHPPTHPPTTRRRTAVEHELEASPSAAASQNAVFDETGHFLVYASLLGIKVVNVETNRLVRMLGKLEAGERFLHVALFQGVPKVDSQLVKALSKGKTASTVEEMRAQVKPDPTVVATAFKKRRFYLFTRRMPVRAVWAWGWLLLVVVGLDAGAS